MTTSERFDDRPTDRLTSLGLELTCGRLKIMYGLVGTGTNYTFPKTSMN